MDIFSAHYQSPTDQLLGSFCFKQILDFIPVKDLFKIQSINQYLYE